MKIIWLLSNTLTAMFAAFLAPVLVTFVKLFLQDYQHDVYSVYVMAISIWGLGILLGACYMNIAYMKVDERRRRVKKTYLVMVPMVLMISCIGFFFVYDTGSNEVEKLLNNYDHGVILNACDNLRDSIETDGSVLLKGQDKCDPRLPDVILRLEPDSVRLYDNRVVLSWARPKGAHTLTYYSPEVNIEEKLESQKSEYDDDSEINVVTKIIGNRILFTNFKY